ncbi:hypothetical protein DSO57_1022271 [Entomophthora muscae]|uniref:Uncharacterized protein n=1 Tax=Entomophthora muscae TaxID=34485 RepID=A0ACC2S5C8_9FUNG|nr:hypothetical protein DSO57_1022271 [Entomophthora muscae]
MTYRGREFIGAELTRLLQDWYWPTQGLAPAEVQVYGGDAHLVIGKVLEEFSLMQAKYKLLTNHSPLLWNDNSFKPVPGYDPRHTLGTGDQDPHSLPLDQQLWVSKIVLCVTGITSCFVSKLLAQHPDQKENWEVFKAAFLKKFSMKESNVVIMMELRMLKMTGTIKEYIAAYKELSNCAPSTINFDKPRP